MKIIDKAFGCFVNNLLDVVGIRQVDEERTS